MAITSTKSSSRSKKLRNKRSWKRLGKFSTNKSNLGLNFVKRTKKKKMISMLSYLTKPKLTSN